MLTQHLIEIYLIRSTKCAGKIDVSKVKSYPIKTILVSTSQCNVQIKLLNFYKSLYKQHVVHCHLFTNNCIGHNVICNNKIVNLKTTSSSNL